MTRTRDLDSIIGAAFMSAGSTTHSHFANFISNPPFLAADGHDKTKHQGPLFTLQKELEVNVQDGIFPSPPYKQLLVFALSIIEILHRVRKWHTKKQHRLRRRLYDRNA
jgi:hypothetical protein